MSNVVEFILRLKDMMSGGMQAAARSTQRALGQNEAAANRLNSAYRRAGIGGTRSIETLERAIRRLEHKRKVSLDLSEINRANRGIEQLQRRIDNLTGGSRKSGGGILRSSRGMIAGLGLAALTAGVGSVMGMGMNAGAQKVSFETMAGAQSGGKLFNDLTKFAKNSIFGNEVYQNAQTMLAFGGNAKSVMPDAKMLGDVSMGNKDRLNSLTLAYSQIQATGKLMGQDLLQLVNAGFNPLQIISEKTGITMGVLKDKMEDGQISAQMVKRAFQDATGPGGRFFDMTNRIAETPFGQWEALKGQISGVGTEFGIALLPVATTLMDAFDPLINKLPSLITQVTPSIIKLSQNITPIITSLGNIFFDVIPPAIKLIANTASILTKVLAPALKVVELFARRLGMVIGGIANLLSLESTKVESSTDKMMKGVADNISASSGNIQSAMSNTISGHGMESLFEQAGKKHGNLYAQALQEAVADISLKMSNQDALATFAKTATGYATKGDNKDAYIDFLGTAQTVQQAVDQLPAMLREVGLKQGRSAFEKEIENAKNMFSGPMASLFSDPQNAHKAAAQIDKIAGDQRKYLEGLANGTTNSSGYEFAGGKKDKGVGSLSSKGVTQSGPKVITVNISKMIEKLEINSVNVKEGIGEMENLIKEYVYRAILSLETAN